MVEFLEKVKEFCKKLGGKVSEKYYPDIKVRVVSCILPSKKDMGVLVSGNLVRLYAPRAGEVEFELDDTSIHLSSREPKHAIFSAGKQGYGTHVWGVFNKFEATYEERLNKFDLSLWESE